MSVLRILAIRCDRCGKEEKGDDPRYHVHALRHKLRALGWHCLQGVGDLCPDCVGKTYERVRRTAS